MAAEPRPGRIARGLADIGIIVLSITLAVVAGEWLSHLQPDSPVLPPEPLCGGRIEQYVEGPPLPAYRIVEEATEPDGFSLDFEIRPMRPIQARWVQECHG